MKTIRALLTILTVAVAIGLAVSVASNLASPEMRAARARKAAAEARIVEQKAYEREQTAPARQAAYEFLVMGLAGAGVGLAVGGSVVLVQWGLRRSRMTHADANGLYPLHELRGRGWVGLVDMNRQTTGAVFVRGGPAGLPELAAPKTDTDEAHMLATQRAQAVQAIAAATRHKDNGRLDVASMLQPPQSLARPLPEVTDADPSHIDRLLELTGPANEVLDV